MHPILNTLLLTTALHFQTCETTYNSTKHADVFDLSTNACSAVIEYAKPRDSNLSNIDTVIGFNLDSDVFDLSEACNFAGVTCRFLGDAQFDGAPGAVTYSLGLAWKCNPITGECGDFYFTDVLVDIDGDGQADMDIFCYGQLFLTEDNFILE